VQSVPTACLDHLLVFSADHLRRAISAYVGHFNDGVRTDNLVNTRPASPLCVGFDLEGTLKDHSRTWSWVDWISAIGVRGAA
jgi:hypothetical protein